MHLQPSEFRELAASLVGGIGESSGMQCFSCVLFCPRKIAKDDIHASIQHPAMQGVFVRLFK